MTVSAAPSERVGDVPAVLVQRHRAAALPGPERAWLALAMLSTLARHLTPVGSVADLIVVEPERGGARVWFGVYLPAGVPLTPATLALRPAPCGHPLT